VAAVLAAKPMGLVLIMLEPLSEREWSDQAGKHQPRMIAWSARGQAATVLSKLAMQAIFNESLSTKSGSGLGCVDVVLRYRTEGIAGRQGERPLLCLARLDVTHVVDVTQLVLIHLADRSLSDETLLEKLAGSNAELRKQLQQLLGSENFETTTNPGSTTKH
jgi:hypothetical protein